MQDLDLKPYWVVADVVEAVLNVGGSDDVGDYVASLRGTVCSACNEDDRGQCVLRELAECALDSYLIPVIEVIEEVAVKRGDLPAARSQ